MALPLFVCSNAKILLSSFYFRNAYLRHNVSLQIIKMDFLVC